MEASLGTDFFMASAPCVTYSPSVVSLRGPGQSPVYFAPHDAVLILS